MVETIKELRKICQKKPTTLTGKIQRRISIYLTRLLLPTGISANQTSILDMLIGIIAGIFFLTAQKWLILVGALIFFFWNTIDYVDGEIARYRKDCSLSGEFLDRLNHMVVEPFLFVCISFGLFKIFGQIEIFAFGFSAALSRLLLTLVRHSMYVCAVDSHLYTKNLPFNKSKEIVVSQKPLLRSSAFAAV